MATAPAVISEDPVVQDRFQAELAREMDKFRVQLSDANAKLIEEELARIRKDYGPPKQEDIQKLLDQEYLTFTIQVPWPGTDKKEYVIRELPQAAEKKFYRQVKDQLLPKAKDIAAISFKLLEGNVEDKVRSVLETFDSTFDILADGVVIVLNPRDEVKEITRDWVQDNISSGRMWNILEAQMAANRLRDFFSKASLTMTGSQRKA